MAVGDGNLEHMTDNNGMQLFFTQQKILITLKVMGGNLDKRLTLLKIKLPNWKNLEIA